jgi:signal transduction histidine kinase
MMRHNSLALRLIASSAIVSIVLLAAAGFLLANLFQAALERNFDARLTAILNGLLANVALAEDGAPTIESELADTRFSLPLSGWYWQVTPPPSVQAESLASPSLLEQRLKPSQTDLANRDSEGVAHFYLVDTNGARLRVMEQRLKLFDKADDYSFLVAGNFDELSAEAQAFQRTLITMLALLGVGLLVALLAQVRYGLTPLHTLQRRLTDIREGKTDRLEGFYPSEIQPVADELNLLLQSNAEIIDRARTQVGNLAHALKTPLSVIRNEVKMHPSPVSTKVNQQAKLMRDQINLYLDRARRAARASSLGAITEIRPALEGIGRALERINLDRGLKIAIDCPRGLKFRGERQDLEEMTGNLLDNACKFAAHLVSVSVRLDPAPSADRRLWVEIQVSDDGPGLAPEQYAEALKRGRRLDESKPGSGLGLSIVAETAAMYGGGIQLDRAELGGLLVRLRLPAVQ